MILSHSKKLPICHKVLISNDWTNPQENNPQLFAYFVYFVVVFRITNSLHNTLFYAI